MRKVAVLIAAVMSVAAVSLVSSAGARDIPVTLNLIAHTTNTHLIDHNRFVATGSLLKQGDRDHRKGHFKAVFNRHNRGRAIAYLHNGKIKVDSVNGGNSNEFRIIGGTRHWAGVTGTMRAHDLRGRNTLLTFDVD